MLFVVYFVKLFGELGCLPGCFVLIYVLELFGIGLLFVW